MASVLAIDHGTNKTGFAVADPLRISVQPIEQISLPGESAELLEFIAGLLDERDVDTFLIGMPYNMDGSEGGRTADVHRFAERLRARFPKVEVLFWDERLTTKAAEDLLRDAGYSGRQTKSVKDSWSALVLLRDWLESGEPRNAS